MSSKKVLVTGAAGLVGGILRSHWGDRHQLRLADIRPVENLAAHEEFAETDITAYDQAVQSCEGGGSRAPGSRSEHAREVLRYLVAAERHRRV